ncbi:MAG: nucleoside 2-deoxyribosyltransferase [Acidimicrobiales bacterium]
MTEAVPGRQRVYLAGPDVFLPNAAEVAAAKQAVCGRLGLVGVHPFDAEVALDAVARGEARGLALHDALVDQLDGCDAGIANLTPFRGPSADVGTALEVGYLVGRGRPVVGYTNVDSHYAERVDADGLAVEDHDLADNLMLEGAVRRSSGVPILRADVAPDRRLSDLAAFERAAIVLAEVLRRR